MKFAYDLDVRALYIHLRDGEVHRTRELDGNTTIDIAEDGTVIGIEVISIDHPWALAQILALDIPGEDKAMITGMAASPPGVTFSVA